MLQSLKRGRAIKCPVSVFLSIPWMDLLWKREHVEALNFAQQLCTGVTLGMEAPTETGESGGCREEGYSPPRKKRRCAEGSECLFCGKVFKEHRNLETHMNMHTGERPHQCKACDQDFASFSRLWEHRQTVHLGVQRKCEICGKELRSLSSLRTHRREVHRRKRETCERSGGTSVHDMSKTVLPEEEDVVGSPVPPPQETPEQSLPSQEMVVVLSSDSGGGMDESTSPPNAAAASLRKKKRKRKTLYFSLRPGETMSRKRWECEICGKVFYREDSYSLDRHRRTVHAAQLGLGANGKAILPFPAQTEEKAEPTGKSEKGQKRKRAWTCDICGKIFFRTDIYSLNRHKRDVHKVHIPKTYIGLPRVAISESPTTIFEMQNMLTKTSVAIPPPKASKEKTFWTCTICGRTLLHGDSYGVNRHLRNVHHIPEEQLSAFSSAHDMSRSTAHSQPERRRSQEEGSESVKAEGRSSEGSAGGTSEAKQKSFRECHLCGCQFFSRDSGQLTRHLKIVHKVLAEKGKVKVESVPSAPPPEQQVSTTLQTVEEDQEKSTSSPKDRRIWNCDLCGKVFNSKDRHSLNRHLKRMHNADPGGVPLSKPKPGPSTAHIRKKVSRKQARVPPRRLFKCDICGRVFLSPKLYNLVRHKRTVHGVIMERGTEPQVVFQDYIPEEEEEEKEEEDQFPHLPTPAPPCKVPDDFVPTLPFKLFNFSVQNRFSNRTWDPSFFLHMNRYVPDAEPDPRHPPPLVQQKRHKQVPKAQLKERQSDQRKIAEQETDPDSLQCPKCEKVYSSKWSLQRHMKIRDCIALKLQVSLRYVCPFCNQDFNDSRYKLIRHLTSHQFQPGNNENCSKKRFAAHSCVFCGYSSSNRNRIGQHILKNHLEVLGTPKSESQESQEIHSEDFIAGENNGDTSAHTSAVIPAATTEEPVQFENMQMCKEDVQNSLPDESIPDSQEQASSMSPDQVLHESCSGDEHAKLASSIQASESEAVECDPYAAHYHQQDFQLSLPLVNNVVEILECSEAFHELKDLDGCAENELGALNGVSVQSDGPGSSFQAVRLEYTMSVEEAEKNTVLMEEPPYFEEMSPDVKLVTEMEQEISASYESFAESHRTGNNSAIASSSSDAEDEDLYEFTLSSDEDYEKVDFSRPLQSSPLVPVLEEETSTENVFINQTVPIINDSEQLETEYAELSANAPSANEEDENEAQMKFLTFEDVDNSGQDCLEVTESNNMEASISSFLEVELVEEQEEEQSNSREEPEEEQSSSREEPEEEQSSSREEQEECVAEGAATLANTPATSDQAESEAEVETTEECVECEKCGKVLRNEWSLRMHLDLPAADCVLMHKLGASEPSSFFACLCYFCGKRFGCDSRSRSHVSRHITRHCLVGIEDPNKIGCPFCGLEWDTKSKINLSRMSTHILRDHREMLAVPKSSEASSAVELDVSDEETGESPGLGREQAVSSPTNVVINDTFSAWRNGDSVDSCSEVSDEDERSSPWPLQVVLVEEASDGTPLEVEDVAQDLGLLRVGTPTPSVVPVPAEQRPESPELSPSVEEPAALTRKRESQDLKSLSVSDDEWHCLDCGTQFRVKEQFRRHKADIMECLKKQHSVPFASDHSHWCQFCKRKYDKRRGALIEHIYRYHVSRKNDSVRPCPFCDEKHTKCSELQSHILLYHWKLLLAPKDQSPEDQSPDPAAMEAEDMPELTPQEDLPSTATDDDLSNSQTPSSPPPPLLKRQNPYCRFCGKKFKKPRYVTDHENRTKCKSNYMEKLQQILC